MPGAQVPKAQETQTPLIRLEELPRVELRTWQLHASNGTPLPMYVRYLGGVWQAFAPAAEIGLKIPGALAVFVTAWTAREAASALWELLDRLGICVAYPELAGPA